MYELKSKKIVILGAGIVGLTTAYQLINIFEKKYSGDECVFDISIVGDKFNVETTSDGAGGLFRPDNRFMKGVPKILATLINLY